MKWNDLITRIDVGSVFETKALLGVKSDTLDVQRQLSRWTSSGRLFQLRRGVYVLPSSRPHPFTVANRIVPKSYVSRETALGFHGFLAERSIPVTSSTTGRPGRWETPLGVYEYRHIKRGLWMGFEETDLGGGERALVATPEKALLDWIHLEPGGDVARLRLENLDDFNLAELRRLAEASGRPKLKRAVRFLDRETRHDEVGEEAWFL